MCIKLQFFGKKQRHFIQSTDTFIPLFSLALLIWLGCKSSNNKTKLKLCYNAEHWLLLGNEEVPADTDPNSTQKYTYTQKGQTCIKNLRLVVFFICADSLNLYLSAAEWTTKFWKIGSILKMKHEHFPDGLFLHLSTPKFTLLYSLSLTAYYETVNFTYTLDWISVLSQSMYVQGCTSFPKIHRPSQKSMWQKADMKQAACQLYGVPTNIRYHRRKFSLPHKLVHWVCTVCLKRDGTCAETRFRLLPQRMSPFKSVGTSVQLTAGSQGAHISGSNAGYTKFRGSVKSTGYPLHSPVSPSLPLPCITLHPVYIIAVSNSICANQYF